MTLHGAIEILGQSHEITVPYAVGDGWEALGHRFHDLHRERNGFDRPGDPLETVTVRATVTGRAHIGAEDAFVWDAVGEPALGTRTVITTAGMTEATVWSGQLSRAPVHWR